MQNGVENMHIDVRVLKGNVEILGLISLLQSGDQLQDSMVKKWDAFHIWKSLKYTLGFLAYFA